MAQFATPSMQFMPASMPQSIPHPNQMDPYARLAWVEQQYQTVFQDASRQFAQNQELLKEKQTWLKQRDSMADEHLSLSQDNASMRESLKTMESEKAAHDGVVKSKDDRIKALEAQVKELKKQKPRPRRECDDMCFAPVVHTGYCSSCFMPAEDPQKGKAQIPLMEQFPPFVDVSDSECDEEADCFRREVKFMEANWERSIYHDTRLEPDAFEWLVDWCVENADRIEAQRVGEREQKDEEVRKNAKLLQDLDDELRDMHRKIAKLRKRRRHIKQKLLVMADETPLISDSDLSVDRKLFLFCRVMGHPQFDFHGALMPFVKRERDMVKIYHQVMSAMRVLHYDLVEAPKLTDKHFKHRNPSPAKWMVLQGNPIQRNSFFSRYRDNDDDDNIDPLEHNYVSSQKEARMACTALQNLLYCWQHNMLH